MATKRNEHGYIPIAAAKRRSTTNELSKQFDIAPGVIGRLRKLQHHVLVGYKGNRNCPYAALVGTNAKGVIKLIVKVDDGIEGKGCMWMPELTTDMMIDAAVKFAKYGLAINGLVRVGRFQKESAGASRSGPALRNLTNNYPDFFIISVGVDGMMIEGRNKESGRVIPHGWKILTGGGQNGHAKERKRVGRARSNPSDVRPSDGAAENGGAETAPNHRSVPEVEGHGVRQLDPGQQESSEPGLHPAEPRHSQPVAESGQGQPDFLEELVSRDEKESCWNQMIAGLPSEEERA